MIILFYEKNWKKTKNTIDDVLRVAKEVQE